MARLAALTALVWGCSNAQSVREDVDAGPSESVESACASVRCGAGFSCVEVRGLAECVERVGDDPRSLGDAAMADTSNSEMEEAFDPRDPTYPADGFCGGAGARWAFCEDFDGTGAGSREAFDASQFEMVFSSHGQGQVDYAIDCATSVNCEPYLKDGALHVNGEDGGFGITMLRIERPIDFSEREAHIHLDTDFNAQPRNAMSIHLSPQVSNSSPDLRGVLEEPTLNMAPALTFVYQGEGLQPFSVRQWKDGQEHRLFAGPGPLGFQAGEGTHSLDIYLTRTSYRIVVDGNERVNESMPDVGFDRAYIYFGYLSYNPNKDGVIGAEANTMMWDNIAFDGPVLPHNALTPVDKQDIYFSAQAVQSRCSVAGVEAYGPPEVYAIWQTWHVQLPLDAPVVTEADIECDTLTGTAPSSERYRDLTRVTR